VTRRPLFLHVGCSKTGTSALQLAIWNSAATLRDAGLGVPLVGRNANVRHLLRPLGWRAASGFVDAIDQGGLDDLALLLRRTPGDRLLVSNEDLAEAGPEHVAAVQRVAEAADLDVRVVVTARDWAKQLPSEWQQLLKHRITTDYETFLGQVRDRDGLEAETFWRRQDLLAVCDRWAAGLAPADVHLVPVPAASVDRDAVFRVFSGLVGFDVGALEIDERNVNLSFGYVEAELLRRLNVALGSRLQDYEQDYMPAVRRVLVQRVMARGTRPRITLPPEHAHWVTEVTQRQLATVLERGYTVHGHPDLLVPDEAAIGPLPQVDEARMAAAATQTLADFAVATHVDKQLARARRRQRREAETGGRRPAGRVPFRAAVGRLRRLVSRRRS
jgi:hypothetical protein